MWQFLARWYYALQYDHVRAGIHALRLDLQGCSLATNQQQAALAKLYQRELTILRKLNNVESIAP
jgi:hypothetical protein